MIIMLIPAFVFLAIGICAIIARNNFIKNGEFIDAMVVKTFHRNNSRAREYFPVYRYSVDGKDYQSSQPWSDPKPKYKKGEDVQLIYNRKNPKIVINPEIENIDTQFAKMFIQNGKYVDAEVILIPHIIQRFSHRSIGHGYFTIFRYIIDGQAYQIKHSTGDRKPKYEDGEIVKLVCSRKNPEKIVNPKEKNIAAIIFIAVGIFLAILLGLIAMGILY